MRINKYLATCGLGSRRTVEKIILQGRVTLNKKIVTNLATTVSDKDLVMVDGKPVKLVSRKIYIMLNKPKGYVTTRSDEKNRSTVFDLVKINERIFPIGRLDLQSEGLLFLTNDGDLANALMHPKFKAVKVYRVRLDRNFDQEDFKPLTEGLELDDGMTAPCQAYYYTAEKNRIEIKLREGRNRQVRRMMEALGYKAVTLKRVQVGPLILGSLPRGRWRHLLAKEVRMLQQSVGFKDR